MPQNQNFCNSGHFFLPTISSPAVLSSASVLPAVACVCVCSVRPVSRANTDAPTSVCCGSHVRPALSYLSTALWLAESGWREQSGTSVASRALWDSGLINYECAEMTLSFSFSFYLFLSFPNASQQCLTVTYSLNLSWKDAYIPNIWKTTLKMYNSYFKMYSQAKNKPPTTLKLFNGGSILFYTLLFKCLCSLLLLLLF